MKRPEPMTMTTIPTMVTVVWAFLCAFVLFPGLVWLVAPVWGWPPAAKITMWIGTAVYAVLLARWSRTRILSIIFPLGLLLGTALWPRVNDGFFLMIVGVWVWIRSGICFPSRPMRALLAEGVTTVGGMALVAIWLPAGTMQWALGIWLFGLVQCLYFYIVPLGPGPPAAAPIPDSFERARREMEQVLERVWEYG